MLRLRVLGLEPVLAAEGVEECGEVGAKVGRVGKEVGDGFCVRLAVFEELLGRLLDGLEPAGVVVKFGVGGLCASGRDRELVAVGVSVMCVRVARTFGHADLGGQHVRRPAVIFMGLMHV